MGEMHERGLVAVRAYVARNLINAEYGVFL